MTRSLTRSLGCGALLLLPACLSGIDWGALGLRSRTVSNEQGVSTALTDPLGREFTVKENAPVDEARGLVIAGIASNMHRWKGLTIKTLHFLVEENIEILVTPAEFTADATDLLAAMPTGMAFTWSGKLAYRIQLSVAGKRFAFQGIFWSEARFLAELKEAVEDPVSYLRRYDPAFLSGRVSLMGESNTVLMRQVEALSNDNEILSRQVTNLQVDLEEERRRNARIAAETLSDQKRRLITGQVQVVRKLRHVIGYGRSVVPTPFGSNDAYLPGQRDRLFYECHGIAGLPIYGAVRMSHSSYPPATTYFGSAILVEPGIEFGLSMTPPVAMGLDFGWSGGLGYQHAFSLVDQNGVRTTHDSPIFSAALRGDFFFRGRGFIGAEAELRVIPGNPSACGVAVGLRFGVAWGGRVTTNEWVPPPTNRVTPSPGKDQKRRDDPDLIVPAVEGRLVGTWFREEKGDSYTAVERRWDFWSGQLTFAYHSIHPTQILVSGNYFESQVRQFAVRGNAPDPAQVSVSNGLVKYALVSYRNDLRTGKPTGRAERFYGTLLVQVLADRKIRVEYFSGTKPDDHVRFTPSALLYVR